MRRRTCLFHSSSSRGSGRVTIGGATIAPNGAAGNAAALARFSVAFDATLGVVSACATSGPTVGSVLTVIFSGGASGMPAWPVCFLISLMRAFLGRNQFVAAHHGAKIVPPCANHLGNMDHEEKYKARGKQEVLPPCHHVASQEGGEPGKLCGFINGESGDQGAESHQDHDGVRNLLRAIKFPPW